MRISDWSSDVCSSDLRGELRRRCGEAGEILAGRRRVDILKTASRASGCRRHHARLLFPTAFLLRATRCCPRRQAAGRRLRSEEHTSELQSLMRISYAVFCLKKKIKQRTQMEPS